MKTELELQIWLASQLPEELEYVHGERGDYFYWRHPKSVAVTPREWDYICRRVEEKLTRDQCHQYHDLLRDECNGPKAEMQAERWTFHKPWQDRAAALMKVL